MIALLLAACGPYAAWPEAEQAFPWVYTPEEGLETYEQVRWETETWDPFDGGDEAALYLLKASRHRPSAPAEVLWHYDAMRPQIPVSRDAERRLSFVGDAMWISRDHTTFADDVAHLLDGDHRIGNLETPTSPDHPAGTQGLYGFNAPPALLDGLPLDILQVNNNHSLDVGDAGLEATVAEIEARGLVPTGMDSHATVDGTAYLSYTWGLNERDTTSAHDLFVVPFGHLDPGLDLSGIADDIAAARAGGAEVIVLLLHWGFEYEYYPDPYFLQVGRRLVEAGADLIVGHGPHVLQPPELCHVNRPEHVPGVGTCSVRTDDGEPRTAAILYSLGNFQTTMHPEPCEVGAIATVDLDGRDVVGLGWTPVANVGGLPFRLAPLDDVLDDMDLLAESYRLDQHLGAHWRRGASR